MFERTGLAEGTHPKGYSILRDRSRKRLLPWHPRASFKIVSANTPTARSKFFVAISVFTAKSISAQKLLLGMLNVWPRADDGERDKPGKVGASRLYLVDISAYQGCYDFTRFE